MSRQLPNLKAGEDPPHPVDIIRELLSEMGSVSRLMEICYLIGEPGLLNILHALAALPEDDRAKLEAFLRKRPKTMLNVREHSGEALMLRWEEP